MPGKKRDIFAELVQGLEEIAEHNAGKRTLKTYRVEPRGASAVDGAFVAEARKHLRMSQGVFAQVLQIPAATVRNWEQGRASVPPAAATLLRLVRVFPDTIERIDQAIASTAKPKKAARQAALNPPKRAAARKEAAPSVLRPRKKAARR